jgi:TonB family protein
VARTESTYARRGWAASIVFHAALLTAFVYVHIHPSMPAPEFVDMSWGASGGSSGSGSGGTGAMSVSPQALEASAPRLEKTTEEDNVALPTRTPSTLPEDAITMPSSKKAINPEAAPNFSTSTKISGDDRKPTVISSSTAGRDVKGAGLGRGSGFGTGSPYGTGSGNGTGNGIGDGTGDGVSYGIQWSGNGTRRLESGALPAYPSGVNREAQIKLKLVVMPSGGVKSAQPLQKGETRLENAALKAVRLWKFDALQSSLPAVDQACVVTFNFKLK